MTPDKMDPAEKDPARPGAVTPESDYSRPTVRGKGMRTGYTTPGTPQAPAPPPPPKQPSPPSSPESRSTK